MKQSIRLYGLISLSFLMLACSRSEQDVQAESERISQEYQKQVEDLEHLIKELMKESTDKTNELKEENYKLKKEKKIDEMLCDPVVNEILCNREVGLEKSE